MKFPKLKHTVLCHFLLYCPVLILVVGGFAGMFVLSGGASNEVGAIGFIVLMTSLILSLVYLFTNAQLLMSTEHLLAGIRQWRLDREEYVTDVNGRTREEIERCLTHRCCMWGRKSQTPGESNITLYYRHSQTPMVWYLIIEKRVAVCSVPHLDRALFHELTKEAADQMRDIPDGRPMFKTKEERTAPVARPGVAILLADTVDENVRSLARKEIKTQSGWILLPCVVECSTGKYYIDCTKAHHAGARPERNYAAAMARHIVFSGRLPRENVATRPPYPYRFDPEDSLWHYLRTWDKEQKDVDHGSKRETRKMLEKLSDGQVRRGEYALYCKVGERLAVCYYVPNEKDDRLIETLLLDEKWELPRNTKTYPIRRKMSAADQESVLRRIKTQLIVEGYRIEDDGAEE